MSPKKSSKKIIEKSKIEKNLHEIYFNKICELGVLRGVQIKSLLGYIDSCSSLIGPRYFFIFRVLSLVKRPEMKGLLHSSRLSRLPTYISTFFLTKHKVLYKDFY